MKEETRYRVTGSLFLLALAVICLPMLLDGAGLPARSLPDLPMAEALPDVPPIQTRVPESDIVERVAQLRGSVDDEGFQSDSGTRFGEPVLTPTEPSTEVWAVQVASFAEAANAEDFRARLRADGYESFISTMKSGPEVLSRVAVGPLQDRERAESLKDELAARYDTQARLMAFSN